MFIYLSHSINLSFHISTFVLLIHLFIYVSIFLSACPPIHYIPYIRRRQCSGSGTLSQQFSQVTFHGQVCQSRKLAVDVSHWWPHQYTTSTTHETLFRYHSLLVKCFLEFFTISRNFYFHIDVKKIKRINRKTYSIIFSL